MFTCNLYFLFLKIHILSNITVVSVEGYAEKESMNFDLTNSSVDMSVKFKLRARGEVSRNEAIILNYIHSLSSTTSSKLWAGGRYMI